MRLSPIVVDLRGFDSEGYKMNRILISILSMTVCLSAYAAEGFSSLEEQMNGKEYTDAGLDKLTPAELEALNNWIRSHSVATLDQPKAGSYTTSNASGDTSGDTRGKENQIAGEMDRSPISSRLIGTFTGWNGNTVFKLENGMIWEQDDNDKFYIGEVANPEITIEPGMFKSWRLSVDGFNSECSVARVQ